MQIRYMLARHLPSLVAQPMSEEIGFSRIACSFNPDSRYILADEDNHLATRRVPLRCFLLGFRLFEPEKALGYAYN